MNTLPNARPHTAYEFRTAIDTTRLVLHPLCRSDAELLVEWRVQDAGQFHMPPPTLAEHFAWYASKRRGRVDYTIVERAERRPSGLLSFRDIKRDGPDR